MNWLVVLENPAVKTCKELLKYDKKDHLKVKLGQTKQSILLNKHQIWTWKKEEDWVS